jgi:DNA-directed RNA polymerase subunit H (RpoH/RPB5)
MVEDLFLLDINTSESHLTKDDTLYIIVKDDVNDNINTILKDLWSKKQIYVVVESISRLQFNILNHILVPMHIPMYNNEEVNEIMKKYNITNTNQFPEISRFDPVAKAICLRPGMICKIIRPSKTSITTIFYRLCI